MKGRFSLFKRWSRAALGAWEKSFQVALAAAILTLVCLSPWAADNRDSRRDGRGFPRPTSSTNAPNVTNATNAMQDVTKYKLVYERNIFNQNRRPNTPDFRRSEPRPTRIERITLIGTMLYETESLAIFDSTESRYRGVMKPSQSVAGFKLASILPNSVMLQSPSNSFELTMGSQLKREEEGAWQVVAAAVLPDPTASLTSSSSSSDSSSSSSAAGADEVLKRLLMRKEKE